MEMHEQLLRDPSAEPAGRAMEQALGPDLFALYGRIIDICTREFGLQYGWRYYIDGKAWLCKVTAGKKTVLWLSAWRGFIKTSFFFTEKTRAGVLDMVLPAELKAGFAEVPAAGKLVPLILDVWKEDQLEELREVIRYKKSLK